MPSLKIDFISRIAPAYLVDGDFIVAKPGPKRELNPIEINTNLYVQYAGLKGDPESFTDFISNFGPVTIKGAHTGRDEIALLKKLRRIMAAAISTAADDPKKVANLGGWQTPEQEKAIARRLHSLFGGSEKELEFFPYEEMSLSASIKAMIRPGPPDGRPTLSLSPYSLWDAMKLQFYQAIASGAQIKKCEWCGSWFEVGPTGKRGHAKFCKDNCRLLSHRKIKGGSK